jgi:hypothetical protein
VKYEDWQQYNRLQPKDPDHSETRELWRSIMTPNCPPLPQEPKHENPSLGMSHSPEVVKMSSQYRSPSWSSMSLDAPVAFPRLGEQPLIVQCIDYMVKPANTNNPYGEIKNGWLKVHVCRSPPTTATF